MHSDEGFLRRTQIGAREAAKRAIRSRWVVADGLRTHYMEAGEGNPIVLVHGGGPGAAGFVLFPHLIQALAQHFRIIAVDLRGYGLTDIPVEQPFTLKRQARHLSAVIDALCLTRVGMVGHSLGTATLVHYVVDNPERVDKVLALSSASLAMMMGVEVQVPRLEMAKTSWDRDGVRSFLERLRARHDLITDDLVDLQVELVNLPGAPEWAAKAWQYASGFDDPHERFLNDMSFRFPNLPVPVRWAWGREDALALPSFAHELLKLMPDMDLVWFEGAGHDLANDVPEELNAMALDFFLEKG